VSSFATSLDNKPFQITITGDGQKAYVSNPGPDKVAVFDATNGSSLELVSVGYTPGAITRLGD
jgi:DNA-binding beta-propeller fold protein YncE